MHETLKELFFTVGSFALVLAMVLLFAAACGQVPSTQIELTIPHKYSKSVPSTDTVGVLCPEGLVAKGATMYFFQNGAPDRLELECWEVRVK